MIDNNTAAAEEVVEQSAVAEAAVAVKKRRPINQQKLQDNIWGWTFCVPLIVGTVLFIYIALIMAVLLSFTVYSGMVHGNVWEFLGKMFTGGMIDYDGMEANVFSDFVVTNAETGAYEIRTDALRWYKFIFTDVQASSQDSALNNLGTLSSMGMTLFNTVFYLIGIPIGMILSMFFAVCMSRDIKGANFFRVVYYLPSVASTVAVVVTFNKLFQDGGVINSLLGTRIAWFKNFDGQPLVGVKEGVDPFWQQGLLNKTMIVVMMVWKGLGGTIILYIAGLSGVNAATKEAAQIDGANGWQIFWKVTMPDLYPVIFYNVVTAIIGGMQIYAEPELFFPTVGGSATNATYLGKPNMLTAGYVSLIWFWGLQATASPGIGVIRLPGAQANTPYQSLGAAYGMVLAIIILVLTLFQFWLDKKNAE